MKHKFKVGDIVIRKNLRNRWGPGRVVQIGGGRKLVYVQFDLNGVEAFERPIGFHPSSLEFYETPIQRMKRKYNEERG